MAKMTYEDYLNKRLAGKCVTSAVALFGINAITLYKASSNFTVLAVNMEDFSFYKYEVIQDRFRVLDFEEAIPGAHTNAISPVRLRDKAMLKWWNCVFFECDGKRSYDSFYDDLHVADDTDITFKNVIKGFESALSKMPLSKLGNHVFLTGDLAENPLLQYVLQNRLSKVISILHCDNEAATYSENKMVILPKEKLDSLKLNTNITIDLASMVNKPISITLPLDSATMDSMMLPNIKWESIRIDSSKDYSVNGLDFKTVKLHVECDVFQNVFLYCEDMSGNQKVIQVN